jgi:tetratricopeptide (TPR) repeat protein
MKKTDSLFLIGAMLFFFTTGNCQKTVFSLLVNDVKEAETLYAQKNFQSALSLYLNALKKHPTSKQVNLGIARCYYYLKQYDRAVAAYMRQQGGKVTLSQADLYYCAEAFASLQDYNRALEYYKQYLVKEPDDQLITKKIWRINNIQFLFEDSLHYAVRPVPVNSSYGELCPVIYKNGIVFVSNRKGVQLVDNINAAVDEPFYKIWFTELLPDTTQAQSDVFHYGAPNTFNKEFNTKFNAGPVSFYENGLKMVFASTSVEHGAHGERTLQLHFAEQQNGQWVIVHSFPYNNNSYSITHPAISNDGKTLYFSSDMKDGYGGMDIYRSDFVSGSWSKPVNAGENINTQYDEVFPYFHTNGSLYFSSNGHEGLGGLDLFKTDVVQGGLSEVQNPGYPLNSNADDFGIIIDSTNTHGYFSSNRAKGGFNDDIYEFDMDLQTYPITIPCVVRYKEHNWSDSSDLKTLAHGKIYLIDNIRERVVFETNSDIDGNFSLVIPYFSTYKIKVVDEDNDENIVSLEISKYRKSLSAHEIVVVKDFFKSNVNQPIR